MFTKNYYCFVYKVTILDIFEVLFYFKINILMFFMVTIISVVIALTKTGETLHKV